MRALHFSDPALSPQVLSLIAEAQSLRLALDALLTEHPQAGRAVVAHLHGRLDELGIGQAIKGAAKGLFKSASAVNAKINQLGALLQNTKPVQDFDARFEALKGTLARKFPRLAATVEGYGRWAKQHPRLQAFIIGMLTACASIAAGPAGGAIVAAIMRGGNELIKGSKLSTAIGKSVKGAAIGWLAGYGIKTIGNALAANMLPTPETLQMIQHYRLWNVQYRYTVNGQTLVNIEGMVNGDMREKLRAAWKAFHAAKNAAAQAAFEHSENTDRLYARAAKALVDFQTLADQAFDPAGETQRIVQSEIASNHQMYNDVVNNAERAKDGIRKLGSFVAATLQGRLAAKDTGNQPAPAQPSPQASAVQPAPQAAPQAPQAPQAAQAAQPPVQDNAGAATGRVYPTNPKLWQRALALGQQQNPNDRHAAVEYAKSYYKNHGGRVARGPAPAGNAAKPGAPRRANPPRRAPSQPAFRRAS